MGISIVLTVSALILHISKAGAVELSILEGTQRNAAVGSNVTFTCFLTSYSASEKPLVKWLFNGTKARCEVHNFTEVSINNRTYNACILTINSVVESSGGLYKCEVYTIDQYEGKTMEVELNVFDLPSTIPPRLDNSSVERRDATLHLLDPATGAVLDDPEYGPVCVQSDTKRRFECRIQNARPGAWNFTWMLGNQTIATKRQARIGGAGLVNVSSWHIVTNPGNETRESNLTCLATSSGQSLSTRVLITFCAESEYAKTVLRVLVSICVTATIATIITHILLCKYYGYI